MTSLQLGMGLLTRCKVMHYKKKLSEELVLLFCSNKTRQSCDNLLQNQFCMVGGVGSKKNLKYRCDRRLNILIPGVGTTVAVVTPVLI